MSKTYLRVSKVLRVLNDGSSHYKYDNGCRNNLALYSQDISSGWKEENVETSPRKDLSYIEKYKKKFRLRNKK